MAGNSQPLFSEAELRDLLTREESQFLEFKSLWDLSGDVRRTVDRRQVRDVIAEYVAAFANADGGTLVLGVEDDGGISGHGYPVDVIEEFLAVPERRLRPDVRCQTQRMVLDGGEVIVIQVPISVEAIMVDGNGFPYRIGDRVLREPQEVINARKEAYRRVGFEQRIRADATVDDLDLDLVRSFFGPSVFAGRTPLEILLRLGLVLLRAGGHGITNAALLLFGKDPILRWHPRAGVRLFRVTGTERTHGEERNVVQLARIDPPIARALPEAYRQAREHVQRSERLHGLFFKEMPEYPEPAWQEAVINAIAHRDYEDQGREIEIWFFDDRMEVRSPGSLVPPVTLELLKSRTPVHASRNPLMVRALAEAGFMRDEGEGIARMHMAMETSLHRPPNFAIEAGSFVVTLHNQPIFEGVSEEWRALVARLPLSLGQRRLLLANPGGFTNRDFQDLNRVSRDVAYREIQGLVSLGLALPSTSGGRGATYRVLRDVIENATGDFEKYKNAFNAFPKNQTDESGQWLESRLPRLRAFLDKQLEIKNSDYRQLFEIERVMAVRELRQLVDGGYLKRVGEKAGARYVPGPALQGVEP